MDADEAFLLAWLLGVVVAFGWLGWKKRGE